MHLVPMTLNLNAKVKTKGPWAAFHDQLSEKDQRIAELKAQVSVSMLSVLAMNFAMQPHMNRAGGRAS